MADNIDNGTEVADIFLKASLSQRVIYEGKSASHCEECDAEIPAKRRETIRGCRLCVDCASLLEHRQKRNKRTPGTNYDKLTFSR